MCCKYPSPIKLHSLLPLLDVYPDRNAAQFLGEGFSFGFKLGFKGERCERESDNLKSVAQNPDLALEKLSKEVELKRIAGPFSQKPLSDLIISPIGLVPKAEPGKFRLIQHLSHPQGNSINDGIDPERCAVKYASFDDAVQMVASVGKGALMAKADIQSAFRLLPVHPEDFQLLGMKVKGSFFVDKSLPMGASCSPAYFEKFSTFIEWAVKRLAVSNRISHYMDDFIFVGNGIESSKMSCHHLVRCFEKICDNLGVPLASEKSVGPATKLTYLGLEIDSMKQEVSVPADKLISIRRKIIEALQSEKVSLKSLQSLIGSLSFICKAVSPGRAFLRRLIDLSCGIKKSWHMIRLNSGAKSDLQMWQLFLAHFNGTTIFPNQLWHTNDDLQLFTDASGGVGFGGFFNGKWFQGKWPNSTSNTHSIAWMEFFPVVVAIVLWGDGLKGKRIIIRSDNEAVVAIVNKQTSKCPRIMKLVRFFVLQCLKRNLAFCARHIEGKLNDIADALSRFQMERFRGLAPAAEPEGTAVPEFLWRL